MRNFQSKEMKKTNRMGFIQNPFCCYSHMMLISFLNITLWSFSWYSLIWYALSERWWGFLLLWFLFFKNDFSYNFFHMNLLLLFFISYEILNQVLMWNILHLMCLILLAQHPNFFCISNQDALLFHDIWFKWSLICMHLH